jgi:hypothetical protein
MLGEALYPRVKLQQPHLAGKITGMLLEMDNMELMGLIRGDDRALGLKIDEAVSVYEDYEAYERNRIGLGEEAANGRVGTAREGEVRWGGVGLSRHLCLRR